MSERITTEERQSIEELLANRSADSEALNLAFNEWTTIDADSPSLVILEIWAQTDGSMPGAVSANIDENGGTDATYSVTVGFSHENLSAGTEMRQTTTIPVPAGASFKVSNGMDPNNGNAIQKSRAITK